MKTIQVIRRENARRLLKEHGGTSNFAALIGREPPYISHILGGNPTKGIGERMARHIEECTRMPVGWLDQDHSPAPTKAPVEATLAEEKTDRDFVTLRIACIQTDNAGDHQVSTAGRMGGVPRAALDRLGITEEQALLVEVHGDAHGLALPDGSMVAVNTTDKEPREGKVYALRDHDMLRVRILVPLPGGGMILRTFNRDDYPDEHLSAEQVSERLEILGRMFWSATTWH